MRERFIIYTFIILGLIFCWWILWNLITWGYIDEWGDMGR